MFLYTIGLYLPSNFVAFLLAFFQVVGSRELCSGVLCVHPSMFNHHLISDASVEFIIMFQIIFWYVQNWYYCIIILFSDCIALWSYLTFIALYHPKSLPPLLKLKLSRLCTCANIILIVCIDRAFYVNALISKQVTIMIGLNTDNGRYS